jgi:hypothetical protein
MPKSTLLLIAASLLSLATLPPRAATAAESDAPSYSFEGFDLKSGQLVFRGEARTAQEGNHTRETVHYVDPAGQSIQTLEVEFDTGSAKLFSMKREYPLTGEMESAVIEADRVKMTHRDSATAKDKTDSIKWTGVMVFPPTVVPRMQLGWETLMAGKKLEIEMVVPNRLDSYGFRLLKEAETELDGKKVVVIVLEPGSMLVRRMVDPMRFVWTVDSPRRLVEYRGRTAIKDAKGGQIDARIVYRYPAQ